MTFQDQTVRQVRPSALCLAALFALLGLLMAGGCSGSAEQTQGDPTSDARQFEDADARVSDIAEASSERRDAPSDLRDTSLDVADVGDVTVLDGALPDAAVSAQLSCIEDGWCWEKPLPLGANLSSVWGSSFDDVWVVGAGATILHFDGKSWARHIAPTRDDLYRVHGSGPNDVWAVGGRTILHWNGVAWSSIAPPTTKGELRTVFAFAPDDVWFAGDYFALVHYDGATFTVTESTSPERALTLIGFAKNDVWVAGDSGAVMHFDGTQWKWSAADLTGYPTCSSAWGTAANNIYLACDGPGRNLVRYDGVSWNRVQFPSDVQVSPSVVTGASANDVWVFSPAWDSASFDGSVWNKRDAFSGEYIADAWLDGTGRGFAVTAGGRILHRDSGVTWKPVSGGEKGAGFHGYGGGFATPDGSEWAAGHGEVVRRDGDTWNVVPAAPSLYRLDFASIWGSSANDVWLVGWSSHSESIQHWDGRKLSVVNTRVDGEAYVDAVWGAASNDVWFVAATGSILHWDGTTISTTLLNAAGGGARGGVHGTSTSDVWMIGLGLRHWDGKKLSLFSPAPPLSPNVDLTAVHAVAKDDVWVAGSGGALLRWNGSAWSASPPIPLRPDANGNVEVRAFAGTSSKDLWAIGTGGDVLHFDGASWSRSMTAGVPLSRLAQTKDGHLIAVWGSGAILRRR